MFSAGIIQKIKSLGVGLAGIAFMIGMILIPIILFAGAAAISSYLYPVVSVLSAIAVIVFCLIVLPLSLFKGLRPILGTTSVILSYVTGVSIWMFSFLIIWNFLGFWALFLMFWFHVVAPIAAIGLFFRGDWSNGIGILFFVGVTYGMRLYGLWLISLYATRESINASSVIDIEPSSKSEG